MRPLSGWSQRHAIINKTISKKPLTANEEISIMWPNLYKNSDNATTHVESGIPKLMFVNKYTGFGLFWHQPEQLKKDSRIVIWTVSVYVLLSQVGQFWALMG